MAEKSKVNMWTTRDTFKEVKRIKQESVALSYTYEYSKGKNPLIFDLEEKTRLANSSVPLGYHLLYVNKPTFVIGISVEKHSIIQMVPKQDPTAFRALWKFCAKCNRVLVCLRRRRRIGNIQLVELSPKVINGEYSFLERVFPFADDLRFFPTPTEADMLHPVSRNDKALVEALVKKLSFEYDPKMFFDPITEKYRAYIKANVLSKPIEEVNDYVNDEAIDEQVSQEAGNLLNIFSCAQGGIEDKKKRRAPPQARRGKRMKEEQDD